VPKQTCDWRQRCYDVARALLKEMCLEWDDELAKAGGWSSAEEFNHTQAQTVADAMYEHIVVPLLRG
jgi:hypothetical protein